MKSISIYEPFGNKMKFNFSIRGIYLFHVIVSQSPV